MSETMLIFGAQPGGLGWHIQQVANQKFFGPVVTAGIGREMIKCDVTLSVEKVLASLQPSIIISTVGVNRSTRALTDHEDAEWRNDTVEQIAVNFTSQMALIQEALYHETVQKIIFISSNSAHIARRNSLGYCASKAALSMGVRCAARELAGKPMVWAYEFGLLRGTPMTQQTEATFGSAQSRMIGAESGLEPEQAARQVYSDATNSWMGLNGATIRLDAGEQ